jgi:hypothetical protein
VVSDTPYIFTDQIAVETMLIMQNAKNLKEATMDMTIELPVNLADLNNWIDLPSCLNGAAHIPLLKVIWDHVALRPRSWGICMLLTMMSWLQLQSIL